MTTLSLLVLGPLAVTRAGVPVADFGYNKVRALLVYLAVEPSRPHSRAHLCALLWPDLPEAASRRNLSQALTQLRRALDLPAPAEPLLLSNQADVQLNPAWSVTVDALVFVRLLEASERHAHHSWHTCAECAGRLRAALDQYRGDFLAGLALPDSVPFEEWALLWRERLRQRALSALQRLSAGAEWRGALGEAAAYARRQAELDPLNEAGQRDAIRLLALNGETAAALAQYAELRRVLADELGLEPEAESVALRDRIRATAGDVNAGALDGLRRFKPPPFTGPRPPTPLIGRDDDLAVVVERLRAGTVRALTLTGPPGIGKTRLALEAAAALRYDFEDGVHVVELAPVSIAAEVPAAIAQALGVKEQTGKPLAASLALHLKTVHSLLVLDNFEHVLEAAGLVADLLAACPGLKVLATSRSPLRIRAEQPLALAALTEAEAARLFAARAGNVPAPEDGEAVGAICRRLDCLPLAIELVAVRARALAPAELLRQLEHPLSALTAAPRDLPERQRTLRGAIAWSYDRLSPTEQRVFRLLGVFAGGGSLEAVQALADGFDPQGPPVLPVLEALHEASLVLLPAQAGDNAGLRFAWLETLREFALEALAQQGELESARQRHLEFFLALAEQAQAALDGAEQARWLARLEADHDNLRAALAYARGQEDDAILRLAVALGKFWEVRGYLGEGRRWLGEALASRAQAPLPVRTAALALTGLLAFRQGDYDSARTLIEQSLEGWLQLEDTPAIIRTLRRLGVVADEQGDLASAEAYYERSLALARETDDVSGVANALNNLGLLASDRGDDERAHALYAECLPLLRQLGELTSVGMTQMNLGLLASHRREYAAAQAAIEASLATFREIGHKWGQALALSNLGNTARFAGQLALAADCYQQSLALYRELGDQATVSYPLFGLGQVAYAQGDLAQARALYQQSLALRLEAGERRPLPRNLEGLGQLERVEGRPERAARLFGAAEAWRERLGLKFSADYGVEYEAEVAALRAALGEAAFEAAWAEGRALSSEAACALAGEG